MDRAHRRLPALVIVTALVLCAPRGAVAAEPTLGHARPAALVLTFEDIGVRRDERLGLLGASYLIDVGHRLWVGPALYGAATGQRGGLFTWGAEAQYRLPLLRRWALSGGLFVGGGGGGGAPVGGGLMLRPHADFLFDLGGWQLGLTVSHIWFPTGAIDSTQVGLVLRFDHGFGFGEPGHLGEPACAGEGGGIGADRLMPTVGVYLGRRDASGPLGLVGMRLELQLSRFFIATLEGAAAASGGADGYMEALAGVSLELPVVPRWLELGAHTAAGLAGGGAVATGGGIVAKLGLVARVHLGPAWALVVEGGRVEALSGDFGAFYAQLGLALALGSGPGVPSLWHDAGWTLSVSNYFNAARKNGPAASMQLIGLSFSRSLGRHFYLTGQAHTAVAGGAGAYAAGLLGVGARVRLGRSSWSAAAEALVGAAGGGGVASDGGAVVQPMARLGRSLGRHVELQVGGGYIHALFGRLSSPVIEASGTFRFATP
jgi:hypothetical protein